MFSKWLRDVEQVLAGVWQPAGNCEEDWSDAAKVSAMVNMDIDTVHRIV